MIHNRMTIAAALVAMTITASATAATVWIGQYRYDEPLGRDGAGRGAAISVEHKLTIGPNGACRLDAEGYQTDTHILCTATPANGTLQVKFLSYVGGGVKNQYGVQIYQIGAPLFLLTRAGTRVTTRWQGYTLDKANMAPGVYFRRS